MASNQRGTPGGAGEARRWAARWREGEVSLGTSPRRMLLLLGLGLLLGGVGGVAAFVVVRLVGLLSNLALLHRVGFGLPDLRHYHPSPWLIPIALAGGLVVAGLAFWSPIIKGHGLPESIEAILLRQSRVRPRTALAKPLSAAVAMGTGGPFGAEGPIIVTGSAIGSLLGQLLPVSPAERRILLACGAAAGMAGVFDTPVAAVVLAFELLLFERSLRALLPLVAATAVASALHEVLISPHPLFPLAHDLVVPARQLPFFAVLGLVAGLLAVVLNKGLVAVEEGFRRLPVPEWVHPVLGALGYAVVGLAVPGSLSVGYWAITDAVNDRFALGVAAVLLVGKTVSWWLGLGSNTSGGTLAPMFLMGATMGELVGSGFARLVPSWHLAPGAFALVGMGVTFGVGARALLTGVIFAAEVTGGFHLLLPLLLATAFAEVVAEALLDERIMTEKLARRGLRVVFDAQSPLVAAERIDDETVQAPTLHLWPRRGPAA
jgi:CIC family chloride channel protein